MVLFNVFGQLFIKDWKCLFTAGHFCFCFSFNPSFSGRRLDVGDTEHLCLLMIAASRS